MLNLLSPRIRTQESPPFRTFYVKSPSASWWCFGLNLFLNDCKQNIPISVCIPFPHHSEPLTCHHREGRFLPSQPSAPAWPCSLLSGDPSNLCRPRVNMPQTLGYKAHLPRIALRPSLGGGCKGTETPLPFQLLTRLQQLS